MEFSDKSDYNGVFRALEFLAYALQIKIDGIISHPIITSPFVMKKGVSNDADMKERFHLLSPDMPEDEINRILKETLEMFNETADGNIDHLFALCHKPYRLTLLSLAKFHLTKKDYTELLRDCWVDTEFPHQGEMKEIIKMFEIADKDILRQEDKVGFDALPERITVYRGIQGKKAKVRALSWTLSLDKARWFANRFEFNGRVYEAMIDKQNVYFYTNSRQEEEVVLNPNKLKNILVVIKDD